MTDYSAVAERWLRAASNAAAQRTDEEDAFESLVSATRRHFRRPDPTLVSPRGRRRKDTFSRKVLLTKLAHIDFLPGTTEQRFLKNKGLGEAKEALVINRSSTIDVIKENILSLYSIHIQSLLRMSGYRLAKCDRSKRIYFMENINNARDLEKELGSSKIVVVPNNDFPNDLPSTLNDMALNEDVNEGSVAESIVATRTTSRVQNSISSRSIPITSLQASTSSSGTNNISQETNEEIFENFDFEEVTMETDNPSILILPTLDDEAEIVSVEITRSNCVYELFNIYSDKSIVDKKLCVTFRDEVGVDGGGLTREMFNIFFKEIENQYFRGEDCLIPFLEVNKMKEKNNFVVIGRILEHMLLLTGTIPSKLSKIVFMLLADLEKDIEETILLNELFAYVNPCLRHILKKAVHDFSTLKTKEVEILQDFFQSYRFFELPNRQKFEEQLCLIATEVLVETPRRLIETLRKGISVEKYEFWTRCDFGTLLEMQKATPTKVANCVVADGDLTNEESRILHYLDMYIRCLSNENISLFVFMITGSFMMPYSINIKFNDFVGLSQRPMFSTCTDTLFLPRSYPSYQDLKNDFNACLQSTEAHTYTTY